MYFSRCFGVVIMIFWVVVRILVCFWYWILLVMVKMFRWVFLVSVCVCLVICIVSLWVGVRIKICVGFVLWCGKLSKYCSVGIMKVVVLFVFVGVEVKILWLFSVCGIVLVWIWVGWLKFIFLIVLSKIGLSLRLVKVLIINNYFISVERFCFKIGCIL